MVMELSIIVGNTRYITKNIVEVEERSGRDGGEMEYGGVGIWGKVQELWAASQLDRTWNKPSTPRMPRKASIIWCLTTPPQPQRAVFSVSASQCFETAHYLSSSTSTPSDNKVTCRSHSH